MAQNDDSCRELSIEINAHAQFLTVIRAFIGCLSKEMHFSPEESFQLEMCVDEACANSISAIQENEGTNPASKLRLDIQINSTYMQITIHDSGSDFSHHFHKAIPLSEKSDRTRMRGYGLQIIKTFMDDVQYVRDPQAGNQLHLIKYFSESQE